jgi:hypothetical protein
VTARQRSKSSTGWTARIKGSRVIPQTRISIVTVTGHGRHSLESLYSGCQGIGESEIAEYTTGTHGANEQTIQRFLDPGAAEGVEMDLIHTTASARVARGDILETVRLRLGETDRG